jgi:membrane-associated phospholipid phosphatase
MAVETPGPRRAQGYPDTTATPFPIPNGATIAATILAMLGLGALVAWLASARREPWGTGAVSSGWWSPVIEVLGSNAALLAAAVATVVTLWFGARRRDGVFVAAAMAGGLLLSRLLKVLFQEPRPPDAPGTTTIGAADVAVLVGFAVAIAWLLATRRRSLAVAGVGLLLAALGLYLASGLLIRAPDGLDGFPSTTATCSATLASAVLVRARWEGPRHQGPRHGAVGHGADGRPEVIALAGLGAFALAASMSRVLLGDHYPADVVAGWAAAIVWILALSLTWAAGTAALNRR